jgi:hypothetical protein
MLLHEEMARSEFFKSLRGCMMRGIKVKAIRIRLVGLTPKCDMQLSFMGIPVTPITKMHGNPDASR